MNYNIIVYLIIFTTTSNTQNFIFRFVFLNIDSDGKFGILSIWSVRIVFGQKFSMVLIKSFS